MDPMASESRNEGEMELQHIGHQHPLLFIQHHIVASEEEEVERADCCFVCGKPVEGWCYGCNECKFYLHKGCAELELEPKINHRLHPQHPLTFLPKSPYHDRYACNLCGGLFWGFVYHCATCRFDLHINCTLLRLPMSTHFPNSLHPHPLFFIQNNNRELQHYCSGCKKPISGPIYHCFDCSYSSSFNLHKECAELPLEINHSYDYKHPLTLLPEPPTHPEECSCDLCTTQWRGFVYSCSLCSIELTLDDLFSPKTITHESHEHPWMLISRQMSFICDFCGVAGDRSPYFCSTCGLFVHRKCISLPRKIMITRHRHAISHSYSLPQSQVEDWTCRICYQEVGIRYGSYCCSTSDCDYVTHVHCATDEAIWDGTIVSEDSDEKSESLSLITDIVEQRSIGEIMVAVEIKHAYHHHNLTLTFSGQIDDDVQCDGCMRSISAPFYSCDQCRFFLHKDCAELPKTMRHPFHKHSLTLTNSHGSVEFLQCYACGDLFHGFSYQCYNRDCYQINFDLRCMFLSDTLKHPSHEHSLYLTHKFDGRCSGCLTKTYLRNNIAYRCMKHCNFILDINCVTLPLTADYKCDKHALTLTYSDDSDPFQHYCDLCEIERDPNDWFYHCADCDNSLHSNCALGDIPYMKLGNKVEFSCHQHPPTFVKNIWNCPPCKVCHQICYGQALECKEPECNFTFHWGCRFSNLLE